MFWRFFCFALLFVNTLLFGEYPNQCCSIPNTNPCRNFYVGFEGGWGNGLGRADRLENVGEIGLNGVTNNAHAFFGETLGAELGWRLYSWLRTDISYSFLHHRYNWETLYPEVNHSFAYLDSHLVLWNGYLHLPGLCFMGWLDPYVGAGIGVAFNRLHEIQEYGADGIYISDIEPKTRSHLCGRIGGGFLFSVTRCVAFDLAFNANYMGTVSSGDTRRVLSSSTRVPFKAFDFKNNWIGTVTLGVKFSFRGF